MKIFISHKQEDSLIARRVAGKLNNMEIAYYLDVLDSNIAGDGKQLTEHIRDNLNKCTDIFVIMSEKTNRSQWVPFEVGMAAQVDMPTATILVQNVILPDFLDYWPTLENEKDIERYVYYKRKMFRVSSEYGSLNEAAEYTKPKLDEFYAAVKRGR